VAPEIIRIRMRDGVHIAAALWRPPGVDRAPTLLAASPYRFDNDVVPAHPVFLWRETGPIEWYLEQGYAFVHMDVRGSGRSEGDYRYMCPEEQADLAEVIEWIAAQRWSNGRVGGIGQSYYARMQWFMAIRNPRGLACIAPYDGNVDTYRASAYTGGIPGEFPSIWFNQTVRVVNGSPAQGPARHIDWDYPGEVRRRPLYDDWWRERAAAERLHEARVPAFSIGVWRKVDLHLNGNIVGFERYGGPKKLLVFGSANVQAAVQDFSSVAFHEKWLLPFYDRHLKGVDTGWDALPDVRWFVGGTDTVRDAATWPPPGVRHRTLHLRKGPAGAVTSLNDGALDDASPAADEAPTTYAYPDPGWRIGVVGHGADGRPEPVRRVLTFATAPLVAPVEIAGPILLELHAASTNTDTDFVVKLSEQRADGSAQVVTKGWLRASHRAIDASRSRPHAPWYLHTAPEPIVPGMPYRFEIAVMPTAHRFAAGSRIRLEIANGDSSVTEFVFAHEYAPWKVGADTLYHDALRPSRLHLPVIG
jgi:predicted acyl esterase